MNKQIELDQALRLIVAGTGGTIGDEFFRSLSKHLAAAFGVRSAFITECVQGDSFRARMLALWNAGGWVEPFDYDIRGTPCEKVIGDRLAYYATGVQELFPKDQWLKETGIESYLAIPLLDAGGRPVGHLGVMDHQAISNAPYLEGVLRVFASRVAAEIRWRRTEKEFRDSQGELEQHVQQRTNQLKSLLETATDAIITIGQDSRILYVNAATQSLFGYHPDELIGQNVTMLAPESFRSRHLVAIRKFIETGQRTISWEAQEFTALHRSGREVPVEVSLGVTRGEDDEYEFTGIIRDVSERKQMEAQLQQREEQLKLITDSLPAFISYIDTEYRYRFVNAEYERYSGVPRDQILGRTIRELWGDAMFEFVREDLQAVFGGERLTHELRLPSRNKSRRHVQANLVPDRDSSGRVVGCYVLGSDITDRVKAEEALQERLNFERLVSELSTRFVRTPRNQIDREIDWALARLGDYFRADRCAICQVSDGGNTAQPTHVWSSDAIEPRQNAFPPMAMARMVEAWRQGESLSLSSWLDEISDADRTLVESIGIKSTLTVPLLVGGHLFGGMGISSFSEERRWSDDTTERLRFIGEVFANVLLRKHAEEQIRRQQTELAHVARVHTMGEMAAGLAHELNQPLTAIAAYSDGALLRLKSDSASPTNLVTVVEKISADAHRAGQIIRRIRQFVRKRDAVRAPVDVNELVHEVREFLDNEIAQNEVAVEFHLADELAKAHADSIEIQQVLLNLVRNAIEAVCDSAANRRIVRIITRMHTADEVAVIVEDSGPGISMELRERVFEPFYTSKSQGLGMGLAVTQTVLQANGGRIWIDESPLEGTRICFCLPIAKEVSVDVEATDGLHR